MSQARDESAAGDDLSALFTLLGVSALPPEAVAAATGRDVATLPGLPLRELVPGGDTAVRWRPGDGWLTTTSTTAVAVDSAQDRVRALVERVAAALPGRPPRDGAREPADGGNRAGLAVALAVVRLAVTAGVPSAGVSLAGRLWAAAEEADRGFAEALTDAGAAAAAAARDPRALGGLLRSASEWFRRHGDLVRAEEVATSEWEVWRRLGDTPMMAASLWRRADMFALRRRGDRELGCYERLESLHRGRDAHARAGLVRVLTAKGSAFLAYGRVESALESLLRAEKVVRALPDFPPEEQAAVFEWTGRALWASGETRVARRRFFDALALLVDLDERGAERIRRLLEQDQGLERLPPPPHPGRFRGPGAAG